MKIVRAILSNADLQRVLATHVLQARGIEHAEGATVQVLQTFKIVDGRLTNEVLQTRVEVSFEEGLMEL